MPWTKETVTRYRALQIEKHGSEEAWKKFVRDNGSIGGKSATKPRGFAVNRSLARTAGKKGGLSKERTSPAHLGTVKYFERYKDKLNGVTREEFIGMYKLGKRQKDMAEDIGRSVHLVQQLVNTLYKENMLH